MGFVPNRNFEAELRRDPRFVAFLAEVTDEAASEVERLAPAWLMKRHAQISGRVTVGPRGAEGVVEVRSPFWYVPEYGGAHNEPTPYIRPGVSSALARRGGRLGGPPA